MYAIRSYYVGLSGAGTGVGATNTITNTIEAGVTGDSSVDVDGAASISATDSASVNADVATASVAVSVGGNTASITLVAAVSVAENTINDTVQAHILDSTLSSGGALDIAATSDKNIDALGTSIAVAVTAGSGTFSMSGAVGVAQATNTIGGVVEAQIADADSGEAQQVSSGGPLTMLASYNFV